MKPEKASYVGGSWLLRTAVVGVVLLAAGAFVLSYSALHAVAVAAGINRSLAGLYPLIIDGFLSIASLAALHLHPQGPRVTWYPWSLLGGFFSVSVWCNALHAANRTGDITLTGPTAALVSAMPPVGLGLAIHLLILMLRPTRAASDRQPQHITDRSLDNASPDSVRHSREVPTLSATSPGTTAPSATATKQPTLPSARNHHDPGSSSPQQRPPASLGEESDPLKERANAALHEARTTGIELSGAELGRQLGVSTRHGRRLLKNLTAADHSHKYRASTADTLAGH